MNTDSIYRHYQIRQNKCRGNDLDMCPNDRSQCYIDK